MSKETECDSFEKNHIIEHHCDGSYRIIPTPVTSDQIIKNIKELNEIVFGLPERKNEGRFKVTKDKFYH